MDCPERILLAHDLDSAVHRLGMKLLEDESSDLAFAYRELKRMAQDVVDAHHVLSQHEDDHNC